DPCSWEMHHCWPGDCTGNVAPGCVCRPGFRIKSGTTHALCELEEPPDLNTCRVSVSDKSGNIKNSTFAGNETNCKAQQDEYIRIQPTELYLLIKASLDLNLGNYSNYVNRSQAGVVGAEITLVKVDLQGTEQTLTHENLNGPPYCQENVDSSNPTIGGQMHDCEGAIKTPEVNLTDGERICADMQASSGGFYDVQNEMTHTSQRIFYQTVRKEKRVCFTYDMTKPDHCSQSNTKSCNSQPLELSFRLTRKPQVTALVEGWFDPIPPGGTDKSASQIEKYRLEVHGLDENRTSLSVQENARKNYSVEWNANLTATGGPYNLTVRLPEEGAARLYAIILEVHDKAGNVNYARRLVLYDNTSTVELKPSASLQVVSANTRSNRQWQTDVARDICLNWTDRFYNSDLYNTNFLMPVKTDTGREIYGDYDQQSGILPITGTDNVIGITKFEVFWSRDGSPRSTPQEVPDVYAEAFCLKEQLKDGETYDIWVRATDIMGNFREENVRVSIDHTGPSVSIEGLRGRFGRDGLYVHNTTDLSSMLLLVRAADPHSGIKTLEWTLGTRDLAADLGNGALGVNRLGNATDCNGTEHCYCPSVGECEVQQHIFTFTSLVSNNTNDGQHHREYYITITATNHASLHSRQMIDILIDESPPTVGVVLEGLSDDDRAEMDFTSSDVVHVRWHGFLDHESGILLYRVVLADRCLTDEEMDAADNATEVEGDNMATIRFPSEGRFFTSVVAYNGAMQPSRVACSDGIVLDKSPPLLRNVSAIHARAGRSISCTKPDQPWLLNANLTRVRLAKTNECVSLCSGNTSHVSSDHLPLSSDDTLDEEVSDDLCRRLPMTTEDDYIILPSDYLRLTWAFEDEESEMEEYHVGMGRDRTTASAPDLLPFTPTHGHHSYHARHSGLGHGAVFFVFLRALSKAGLQVQLTLGPVIIDVTPPDVTQLLTAEVDGDFLVTKWNKHVFKDSEQPAGVEFDVTYRVGHTDAFVTPFLSMPDSALAQCRSNNISGCARYPVRALHAHDTEQGLSFFFQLHVSNAAGHVTSINTSSVRLPAHYPPSHAVVTDVLKTGLGILPSTPVMPTTDDVSTTPVASVGNGSTTTSEGPTTEANTPPVPQPVVKEELHEFTKDVDVILQRDEVCVAWSGFHHEDEVTVEVGLGTDPAIDDVLRYSQAENNSPVCFNATYLPVYSKLYSVIRATSSGGTTILSSDGFRMIPRLDAGNKLMVFNGKGCSSSDVVGSEMVTLSSLLDLNLTTSIPLHPGDKLFVRFTPFIPSITFHEAVLLDTTLEGYQLIVKSNTVKATLPVPVSSNTTVEILNCLKNPPLLPVLDDHVSVTWEMAGPWTQAAKYLKVEIVDEDCMHEGQKKDKYRHLQCRLAEQRLHPSQRKLDVHGETVLPGHSYTSYVSVCFDDECLPAVSSQPVKYDNIPRSVNFQEATIVSQSTNNIEGKFAASISPPFNISASRQLLPCVFKWTIARDDTGSTPVAGWRVGESQSCFEIQVQDSVDYTGTAQGSLFMCVHPMFPWKAENPTCHIAFRPRTRSLNQVNPFHVIELAHSTLRETDFSEFLHSSQLGSKLQDLYDLDLDFARSDVLLSAIVTAGEGREVTWFLSTSPRVPVDGNCAGDVECVTSKSTTDGKVVFPRADSKLEDGKVYFICASVSATDHQSHEVCGDGVVIDDIPPVAGSVIISNADSGYLPDGSHLLVTWRGFSDVEKKAARLPDDVTITYFVSLGSYPGGEDIAHSVNVGQRTSWTFERLSIASGVNCIATVKAKDRVGHTSESWSQAVIVDTTPPVVGRVAAGTITQERFVPGHELPIRWEGVEDLESGIDTIEVAIVSEEGQEEVIPFERCHGDSALLTQTSRLVDGHSYVALLKLTNKAGMSTLVQSEPFIIDSTPPGPGTVWNSASNSTDHRAYSTEVGVYRVHWSGFNDPHSGLHYYRVGLGSQPGQTDVHPLTYVGLQTFYVWRRELAQGKRYYTTVEACNKAALCRMTSSSSLTFDNSPPTPGRVVVGFDGHHSKYLGHNSSLPVQWTGFSDPQTGISEFWWCVGTTSGGCDVAPPVHTMLSQATVRSGIALPVATPLYVTVRARNPAGLDVVSTSDSFQVDVTPPEVVVSPEFLSVDDGSPVIAQRDRSVLRLVWQFRDPDSSVASQTVSIRSQLTGRLVADPVTVATDTEMILPLEVDKLLLDGDHYWAVVTACNAAGLCTTANSSLILIDSTPPVRGTFESPLAWVKTTSLVAGNPVTRINVTWRAFADAESGVAAYYLSAGRRYNGEELSDGQVEVLHDNDTRSQRWTLELKQELEMGDVLHLSIFAKNGLGLRSPIARMEFQVFVDGSNGTVGSLISVRHSCVASYCTGECACAAERGLCKANRTSCSEIVASHPAAKDVQIVPYIGLRSKQQDITTSVKCLEGHWDLSDPSLLQNISRFEWSFGLANMSAGEGVFFVQNETIWHDVGRNMDAVHCLPGKRVLNSGQRYILHVRTWLSSEDHVTVTSSPVVVDHTPPQVRRGGAVVESNETCLQDIDYVTTEPQVTACWDGVFRDPQSQVVRYEIWVGTSPYAEDFVRRTHVGSNTTWTLPTVSLERGTRYYITVRAVNGAGLMTTAVSDGVVVDVIPPVAGVVFNTHGHTNRHAQSSTTTMHVSWHGFDDRHSGVTSYHVALYDVNDTAVPVVGFQDAGVQAEYIFEGVTLQDKHSYRVLVKAIDAAGLESEPAASDPILIDTTPPAGITCDKYHAVDSKNMELTHSPSVHQDTYLAKFFVEESARDELVKIVINAVRLQPQAGGYITFAELKMPLYFKFTQSGNASAEHELVVPATANRTLSVTVEANTGAKLSAELYHCKKTSQSEQDSVTIHHMSEYSVSVCARIRDEESGIRSMMAGLGTTPGGLQVKPLIPVGHSGHALVNVHLQHGLPLYATVHVENHAGHWSRFISQPITVDRTPPEITQVKVVPRYEGEGQVSGTEVWIEAEWTAVDEESGVASCTCKLDGQTTVGTSKKTIPRLAPGQCQWRLQRPQHGASVWVTVSCVNGVQIHRTVTSEKIDILLHPPLLIGGAVKSLSNNIMMSPFERPGPSIRSTNSSLEFCLHGVDDPTITEIQYRFLHESRPLGQWSPLNIYKTSAVLERNDHKLPSGSVTAQVRAVNARQMMSDITSATVELDDSKPVLTGHHATAVWANGELELTWSNVFRVKHDVTYSVYAGTAEGYGDVINHVVTKTTSYAGPCAKRPSDVHATITAVYANGLSELYQAELKL
ncbi:hypothetical protein BaRGS_00015046, partial [Batillaria attramentaria]